MKSPPGPRHLLAAALALLLAWSWLTGDEPQSDRAAILEAIRHVESGGRDDPPDGDDGRAIGPFQIHRVYWEDAVTQAPELRGAGYQACRDDAYARRVIAAYMQRWAPEAWAAADAEVIARIHNGGPQGAERDGTLGYWRKVRARLEAPPSDDRR